MYRNTYLEVNLDSFHENLRLILHNKKEIIPVLKGNAYGHGMILIAKEIEEYKDIKIIAVATLNEAIAIARVTSKRILILSFLEDELLHKATSLGFIPTIWTLHQAMKCSLPCDVFINVDTGFNRAGGSLNEAFHEEVNQIHNLQGINILGVFTHLRLTNERNDNEQIKLFQEFRKRINVSPKYWSVSDSICITRHPDIEENVVRVGSLLFGLTSDKETGKIDVKPIQRLASRVSRISNVPVNSGFGYSHDVYKQEMRIATVGIGYADGISREMQDIPVTINNQLCPIKGINGMDQLIIDITDKDVCVGDEVVLFGEKGITISDFAKFNNTNKNKVLSSITDRVTRVYKKNGKTFTVDKMGGESVGNI